MLIAFDLYPVNVRFILHKISCTSVSSLHALTMPFRTLNYSLWSRRSVVLVCLSLFMNKNENDMWIQARWYQSGGMYRTLSSLNKAYLTSGQRYSWPPNEIALCIVGCWFQSSGQMKASGKTVGPASFSKFWTHKLANLILAYCNNNFVCYRFSWTTPLLMLMMILYLSRMYSKLWRLLLITC